MPLKKISASALHIVIIIALVIGIICSSIIFISYYYKLQLHDDLLLKRLDANARSGMNILISRDELVSLGSSRTLDLFGENTDSVSLRRVPWGIYEVATVTSFAQRHSQEKRALIGYDQSQETPFAVYLCDLSRPLSLAGSTILKGDCYLPDAGVKRAYIEGQSFMGMDLVQGKIKKSKATLPALHKEVLAPILRILTSKKSIFKDSLKIVYNSKEIDSVQQSFADTTVLFVNKKQLTIGKYIQGNVIITSDTTIIIEANDQLNNSLVIAPAIVVRKGFKGAVQLFAKDSIVIEEDCELTYPSVLGLFKLDYAVMQPFIRIAKDVRITGVVFSYQTINDLQQTAITISKKSTVLGEVYADGFLDVQGTVYGTTYCNKFILKTPSTIYENHLLNATIDRSKRSNYYVGSSIFQERGAKKVIDWLK